MVIVVDIAVHHIYKSLWLPGHFLGPISHQVAWQFLGQHLGNVCTHHVEGSWSLVVDTRREEEELPWGGFGTCANTPCLHLHNWIIVIISIEIITISIKKHHHHQQHVPTVLAQHTLLTLPTQLDHRHQKYIIVNMTLT